MEDMDFMHVIRFRRLVGEPAAYKEISARLLAAMKL